MSRNAEFEESLRKTRRRVYYLLDEKARQFEDEIGERLCKCFVKRARERLLRDATPKDEQSMQQLSALANSIDYRKLNNGAYSVKIPADEEGLFLYLEYGTGIMGEQFPHPEAGTVTKNSAIGWNYNSNKESIRTSTGAWFFKRDNNYVDSLDKYPTVSKWGKSAHRIDADKNYIYVDSYWRTNKKTGKRTSVQSSIRKYKGNDNRPAYRERYDTVKSWGLLGTRYIYNTKQEIKEIFRTLKAYSKKSITIKDVFDKIDELERRPV